MKTPLITKQQELAIISAAINKLGENSYLGPWLASIRHELEAMIRADVFPCISLAEAEADARRVEEDATRKGEAIEAAAFNRAETRRGQMEREVEQARALIRQAQNALLAIEERL